MTARSPLFALLTLLLVVAGPHALAETPTISVVAVGEAQVRPDTLLLSGTLSETNEKMKDAVTGFRDNQRRALASLKEAGIEGLEVTTSDLSVGLAGGIGEMNPFGGFEEQEEPMPKGALMISQTVTLSVTGVDKLDEQGVVDLVVKVIGAAREAGLELSPQMGPQQMMMMQWGMEMPGASQAQFKISDPEAARRQALKAAMDKARADAAFLAELSGGKVGRVVSVSDAGESTDSKMPNNPYAMMFGMLASQELGEFTSTTAEPVKIARGLSVKFELITE